MMSLGATCEDSVAGCLVLSIYRTLMETVRFLEAVLCALPEIVQFNPSKLVAANISSDAVIREMLQLARCIKNFFFILDNAAVGSPPGARQVFIKA